MFTRHTVLFGFFVINTAVLCILSVVFSLDCTHFASRCNESVEIITYIYLCCVVVYGASSLLALSYLGMACYTKLAACRILRFLMILSSGDLIFAVAAGIGMLISLFFSFDPSRLEDGIGKVNFAFLWVVAVYGVASHAAVLATTLYFGNKLEQHHTTIAPEYDRTPEVMSVSKLQI